MVKTVIFLTLLPALVMCSREDNIHLLEDEIAEAIRACTSSGSEKETGDRQRRSETSRNDQYNSQTTLHDGTFKNNNLYDHERRNSSDLWNLKQNRNVSGYDLTGYESHYGDIERQKYDSPGYGNQYNYEFRTYKPNSDFNKTHYNRTRKSTQHNMDQCLSQCVFANLQVVDARGIPREGDFWNKVQTSVTSQQSRTALQGQIRECYQELQWESDDEGCSYSNKLERCLMLRISDRKKKLRI